MHRSLRVGGSKEDLEEVLELHKRLYCDMQGYGKKFIEYVKDTIDDFDRPHSERERLWLAESLGEVIGCLAVVERSQDLAQVRWFLVSPTFRRKGIGTELFKEAMDFIHTCGYKKVYLTTQDNLEDAARIYRRFDFRLVWEGGQTDLWGSVCREQKYEIEMG